MKYQFKQFILILLILLLSSLVVFTILSNNKNQIITTDNDKIITDNNDNDEPIAYCYYQGKKTDRNFYDNFWMKIYIRDNNITGEYQSRPAEKDSKIGEFSGIILDQQDNPNSKTANVWWDSFGEGMNVTEELLISFNEKQAKILMGDMVDRGDGVYVYADKNSINYELIMENVDCKWLNEKLDVEQYVYDNISTLAVNPTILGGTWYALSVNSDPINRTGEVIYEDGHIQSTAYFEYQYDELTKIIYITNFKII